MKVLFWTFGRNRFVYPSDKIAGGIEMVEINQLEALKTLGYDVTVAITQDGHCKGLKAVTIPIDSFEKCGQYKLTKALDFINTIADQYDVVLTNRCLKFGSLQHKRMELFKLWAPKFRQINHEPPAYLKSFNLPSTVATSKWLTLNGAKTATVMEKGFQFYEQLETNLRTGVNFPQQMAEHNELFDSVPAPSFTDFYEVCVVGKNFGNISAIKSSKSIAFVGRPTSVKGLAQAIRGVKEAQRLDDFVGFTVPPSGKAETKSWEGLKDLQKFFYVLTPHDEIMRALTAAGAFLQPTASECSGGIVSFEAAAHGVPVITSTDSGKRYLDPYGLFHFIEDRSPATIAEAIASLKFLTSKKKQDIAMRVREDFSQEVYAENLAKFLA